MYQQRSLCIVALSTALLFSCANATQARNTMIAGTSMFLVGSATLAANGATENSTEAYGISAAVAVTGLVMFMSSATSAITRLGEDDRQLWARTNDTRPVRRSAPSGQRGGSPALPSAAQPALDSQIDETLQVEARETLSDESADALRAELPSLLRRDVQEMVDRCLDGGASACLETAQVFELGLMTVTPSLPAACTAYHAGCELGSAPACHSAERVCE